MPTLVQLDPAASSAAVRLCKAKSAFTTRRVPGAALGGLVTDRQPRAGDLVLARVGAVAPNDGLQLGSGRRARIHEGDEILVCYGNRYATHQWEAIVPPSLETCELVAFGGVAGKVRSRHAMAKRPPSITPIGLAVDDRGVVVNLRDHALPVRDGLPELLVPMIAVVGTSMDAGKTTTASALIRGLRRRGLRVAGIKLTGTGACGDYFLMVDAGADWVADFTDAGFVSTYHATPAELLQIMHTLIGHAVDAHCEVIVAEVADGLLQAETAALLAAAPFRRVTRAVVLAASDALGAQAAVRHLCDTGLTPNAVSGLASASTLTALETREATGFPVLGLEELVHGDCIEEWLHER